TFAAILPPFPTLVLSIGHGHGVLEAHLLQACPTLNLLAIDIIHKQPQYLPEQNYLILPRSSEIYGNAKEAEVWMFIYPRDLGLVRRYLGHFPEGNVRTIIFVGPRADIREFEAGWGIGRESKGEGWRKEMVEENGLKEYEGLVVWRKDGREGIDRSD
ncbi:MAG: hypothetical protein Q9218_008171, partial [Villophora microphyllina]